MDSSLYQNSYTVVITVASLLFVVFYQILIKKLIFKNSESRRIPPGSTGLPFIGETLNFMSAIKSENGIYDFVRIRRARYGNCFKTNIFGATQVFVSSTSSAKAIMNNASGKFTKRYIKSVAELVGSKSILCAPFQHHKLVRGRLSNVVSSTDLSLFVKRVDQLMVNALATWEHRQSVVVIDEALKIATAAMCKMLMSLDENGPKTELFMKEVAFLCKALISFPIKIPGTRFYKGLQARKRIMALIENEICDRRNGPAGQHEDLLEGMLDRHQSTFDNSSFALDDQEIKDNILTFIIAGQDTTASSITWMVKYLDENQDVLDKLRKEHLEIGKKKAAYEPLTLEDLNDMSFASKVVKETLRKASIVAWFPRLVLDDCKVEGYDIKKGWSVNIDAKQVHNDPTIYNDPYAFNPSRFDQDESKVPYSFLAFGMGARTCLGINMAKSMMLVFLHRLITTYRWELTNTDTSVEKMAMFTRLRSGCPMTVKRITT